jgi:AAA domain
MTVTTDKTAEQIVAEAKAKLNGQPAAEPALYVDIAALLDGELPDPPAPVLLKRTDGNCLFYAGQVNNLFGDPETGKTWVALAALAEALGYGRRGLMIDLDHNGAAAIVARLLGLGVPPGVLRDPGRFRYAEPEDADHVDNIIRDAVSWRPAAVIVDSIGELLPLLRLSSNSPDDFTTAFARVLKPMAMAGAAVLAVDHLAKNPDSRAQGASGTAAKRRSVGGTSLRVSVKEPFTPGQGGSCWLNIHKDRHGGLRAHCPADSREPAAGVFELVQDGEVLTWRVGVPKRGDSAAAAGVADEDLAELDALDPPPASQRDVQDRLKWGGSRALVTLRAWRELHP